MKVVALALLLTYVVASNCGGNCPGGCDSCPCGDSPDHASGASWCGGASWSMTCCECIANHESGDNGHAVNQNVGGSYDVGFWQINDQNWGSCSGGSAPCDIATNKGCAEKVWGWGSNTWSLWSTCGGCGCCSSGEEQLKIDAEKRLMERGWKLEELKFEVLWFLVDTELERMALEDN